MIHNCYTTFSKNFIFLLTLPLFLLSLSCDPPLPPEAQYKALAKKIEKAIQAGEIDEVYKKFNSSLFMRNLREKIVLPKAERKQVKELITDTFYSNMEVIVNNYSKESKGVFQFDTLYFEGRTGHLVFSMLNIKGEMNFVSFYIDAIENQLFISDYLSYFSGVRLSRVISQVALAFHSNNADRRRLGKNPFYEANKLLSEIRTLYGEGACNEAWDIFDTIEPIYQKLPSSLVLKMLVGSCTDPIKYELAAREFIKHELIAEQSKMFHQLLIAGGQKDIANFDLASTALKKYIGENENITLLKSVTLMNAEEYEGAILYMDRCFAALNNSLYTHKMKLCVLMELGRVQEAQSCLETMKKQFDMEAEYLNNILLLYPRLSQKTETAI